MSNTLGIDYVIDAAEFAADMPSVLTWSGQSVTGTQSGWTRDLDAEAEGILNAETCEWIGAISGFTASTLPANNAVVTVGGVAAHITSKRIDADDAVVVLSVRRKAAVR